MATLVRRRAAGKPEQGQAKRPAVLYVHGFVDYFFHPHVADAFEEAGYRFYAVDLRTYGRSLGRGVEEGEPNYVRDISVHARDIDAALAAMAEEGDTEVVLLGHSTGGLITPMWAAAHPGRIKALVLNSPWLDLNENWLMRHPVTQLVRLGARLAPKAQLTGLRDHYGKALHQGTGGEWDYDLAWKPHEGFPIGMSWLASVRRSQARLKRGLGIDVPILVLTSHAKGDHKAPRPDVLTTDSVLDPGQMWRRAPRLGPDVEVRLIRGGAHVLALSPEPARSRYLEEVLTWLNAITDTDADTETEPGGEPVADSAESGAAEPDAAATPEA
jgi:alpha-beta hydrolase superfamily lysophospholipase